MVPSCNGEPEEAEALNIGSLYARGARVPPEKERHQEDDSAILTLNNNDAGLDYRKFNERLAKTSAEAHTAECIARQYPGDAVTMGTEARPADKTHTEELINSLEQAADLAIANNDFKSVLMLQREAFKHYIDHRLQAFEVTLHNAISASRNSQDQFGLTDISKKLLSDIEDFLFARGSSDKKDAGRLAY